MARLHVVRCYREKEDSPRGQVIDRFEIIHTYNNFDDEFINSIYERGTKNIDKGYSVRFFYPWENDYNEYSLLDGVHYIST